MLKTPEQLEVYDVVEVNLSSSSPCLHQLPSKVLRGFDQPSGEETGDRLASAGVLHYARYRARNQTVLSVYAR